LRVLWVVGIIRPNQTQGDAVNVLEHFRSARKIVHVGAGASLFREGERPDYMYVLLEGMADILVGGTQVELANPGSILGEMALVDGAPRSATVVCRTNCRFVAIDQAHYDLLVREKPEFSRHVMAVMAERLRRMNERLKSAIQEVSVRARA